VRRRSKEIAFFEDLRLLVEDMERQGLHRLPAKQRMVPSIKKPKKNQKKAPPTVSAIFDVQVAGAEIWQNSKFTDFLKTTTYDPATGYPIEAGTPEPRLNNGSVFDNTSVNPLEHDAYEDMHGDDENECGLASLGGGDEFSTGEIIQ